jgi:signal transduction histidine kinase
MPQSSGHSGSESSVGPSRAWLVGSFVAALLLLAGIALYGVRQNQRTQEARAYAAAALRMEQAMLDMENVSTLMEVHQRGFLVTGDAYALRLRDAQYREGVRKAAALRAAVAGNPAIAELAARVVEAFDERYRRMREFSDIAKAEGLEPARRGFLLRGQGSVDPVMAHLEELRQHQARVLSGREADADREAGLFRDLLLYGNGFALLLLVAAMAMLLRQLLRNERLRASLAQASRQEAERAAELERSNRELEAFSYTISHDLRAPLRHLDGYARILQEDAGEQLAPELRAYLDTISDSSRRMGMLIDDLLAFSRLGRKPLSKATVDIGDLTRRAYAEVGGAASEAAFAVGELPEAHADPVLLRQVWVNLLSNALKYSAPKGADARIEVSGERQGAVNVYRFRDNGVGFDMRYADKLFGVFQRMHSHEEFEGTGVGLAIVRQIVERHGGRVHADAEPGRGATFTLELPAEETE